MNQPEPTETIICRASSPGFLYRPEGDIWTFNFSDPEGNEIGMPIRISSADLFGLLTGLHRVGCR